MSDIKTLIRERLSFHSLNDKGFIVEAKDPHEIYNEYYSDIPYDDFYKVIKADPRTKEKNGKVKKIGKYAKILLDLYRNDDLRFEDLDKAEHYLDIAYERNVPLPKEEIESISDIYEKVKSYIAQESYDVKTLLDMMDSDEYELIKNTENWYVFRPYTENAACKLGAGTEWCTAHGEYAVDKDKQDRSNAFEVYGENLKVLINKGDNGEKYQYYYNPEEIDNPEAFLGNIEFMDKEDSSVDIGKFLTQNQELIDVFIPNFDKIDNITSLNMDEAHTLLACVHNFIPDAMEYINANDNSLLNNLYMGLVAGDEVDETIMEEHVNDIAIESVAIDDNDFDVAPDYMEIEVDPDSVSESLESGDKTVEKLKMHSFVFQLANDNPNQVLAGNIPGYLENDPVINNIDRVIDLMVEEALNRAEISDNDKRESIKNEIKKDESFYKALKGQVANKIVRRSVQTAQQLVPRRHGNYSMFIEGGEDLKEIRIDYMDCLLPYVETNNIKELNLNTLISAYDGCQKNFPAVSSYEEFFQKRKENREEMGRQSNVDNEELQGFGLGPMINSTLFNKINEIMDNNQMEGEIKKIKRLIEHRQ